GEGSAEADRNAQSLADLRAFDVSDILADPESFELPAEAAIRARLANAAETWEDGPIRTRVCNHLVAAWKGLRIALRLAPRTDSSLRLVDSLGAYGAYLNRIQVSTPDWDSWPPEERAERLLARLGDALPELRLFRLSALAAVLGAVTRPPNRPESVKKTGEQRWDRILEEMLVENLHWASDHGALADAIAGRRTVHDQIDALVRRGSVKLRSSGGNGAEALERFCQTGDDTALEEVEWLFHEEPNNRRSRSMGLQGLLIARGRGEARVSPIDRLANETESVLGAGLSMEDRAELRRVLDAHRQTRDGRALLAATLTNVAGGEPGPQSEDFQPLVNAIVAVSRDTPEKARALAERWAAIDATETGDIVTAPSLLLGLARLLAGDDADLESTR